MAWKIPLFKTKWSDSDIVAVNPVLRRGTSWAAGPEIEEFEQALAAFTGRKYALTCNSGTSALQLMYQALDIKEKEVIVPSFTFVATANAIVAAGGIPIFAESEAETFGLDAADVEKRITRNTKAIVALHYAGGVSRDIEKLQQLAQKYNLILLEDNAHSLGVHKNGKQGGTFGVAAALSFCQNKLITTGEGGAMITDSQELYQKMKLLRSHGRVESAEGDYFSHTGDNDYTEVGYNFRMPTMNAALGLSQLRHFDETMKLRVEAAHRLNEGLSTIPEIKIPLPYPHSDHYYQMYTLMLPTQDTRDALQKHLEKAGIMSKVYYTPIHLKTLYMNKYGYKEGDLRQTEEMSSKIVTLPMYPGMSEGEIETMVDSIQNFFGKKVQSKTIAATTSSASTMTCSVCHEKNEATAIFCRRCVSPINVQSLAEYTVDEKKFLLSLLLENMAKVRKKNNHFVFPTTRNSFLQQYLNVYWLRPETAIWRTIEAEILTSRNCLQEPLLDLGCGDGVNISIVKGNRFSKEFDTFLNVALEQKDIYDFVDESYVPLFEHRVDKIACGLDIKPTQVKKAQRLGTYTEIIQGDIHHLPWHEPRFKTVYSNVIKDFEPVAPILREVHRILLDNGTLVLTTPNQNFKNNLYFVNEARKYELQGEHQKAIKYLEYDRGRSIYSATQKTAQGWRAELEQAGFEVVGIIPYISPELIEPFEIGPRAFSIDFIKAYQQYHQEGKGSIIKQIVLPIIEELFTPYLNKVEDEEGSFMIIIAKKVRA